MIFKSYVSVSEALFQLKFTVLWVVVIFVPSSQVLAFAGPIKTDFPGALITGSGVGPGSPPPQEKRNVKIKTANRLYLSFMGRYFLIILMVSSIVSPFK
jgi:hypothetical protein